MPRYDYRATDAKGLTVSGIAEAANEEMARDTLKDRGLVVISLSASAKRGLLEFELPFFKKIPVKDLVIFSRQFAVLMGAKMPIVNSLKTVARQTKSRKLAAVMMDLSDEVEAGTALSVSMAKYPNAFSPFFVNMIRSGETTGRLEDVMNYMADQMERDYDLNAKIKGAMIYPIFVIIGLVIVGFIMMAFVVPKLTDVLKESGAKLPWATQALIFISGFMKRFAIQIIIATIAAVIGMQYWIRTPVGRRFWDRFVLMIPVFGVMLQQIHLIRFTRSFATLVSGGVDVPASLEVCADVVGNETYKDILVRTKKEVMDGNSITTVMMGEKLVPKMVSQMMAVGEETGRLFEVTEKLTEFYSRELTNKVSNLVSAIEPLIMMVMGAAVGVMVVAIIAPMYQLATQF